VPVWAGMGLILGTLGVLLVALRWWQRAFDPPPEIPRKAMHIAMGLITVSLPWLFMETWPVLVLAAVAFCALLAVRVVQGLNAGLGRVLHSIDRQSYGELAFPLAVAGVFLLAGDSKVMYVVPILMLTLADAVAAVIGLRYGAHLYSSAERPKSVEGSAAFFVVAFVSAFVPLQLMTGLGLTETLLISVMLGALVMIVEAISWTGLDNLFVPIGTWVFLNANIDEPVAKLTVVLAGLLVLAAFGFWFRTRTTLNDSAVMASALAGWTFWALMGPAWLIGPFAMFVTYALVPPLSEQERGRSHDTRIVIAYVLPGLFWTFWGSSAARPELLYPFSVAFAALSAMIGTVRLKKNHPAMPVAAVLARSTTFATVAVLLPWLLLAGVDRLSTLAALLGVALTLASALVMWALRCRMDADAMPARRWVYESAIAFAVSLAAQAIVLGR
jgi:phytol kinase